MELLKTGIEQYKELYSASHTHEEASECIISDVLPDVMLITAVSAGCKIGEKTLQSNRLKISGDLAVKIFYTAEDSAVATMDTTMPFSHFYDIDGCDSADRAKISMEVLSATAITVNPRKLSIAVTLGTQVGIFTPNHEEFVSDAKAEENEQLNTLIIPVTNRIISAICEKKVNISEEIRITSGISDEDCIINTAVEWCTEDIKALTNRVMVRGTAIARIVTMSKDGETLTHNSYNLPFSQILESDTIDARDELDVSYQTTDCVMRLVARAEGGIFLQCDISAGIFCVATRTVPINILTDIYSITYDVAYETKDINTVDACENQTVNVPISCVINPDFGAVRIQHHHECCQMQACDDVLRGKIFCTVVYENVGGKLCTRCCVMEAEAPKCEGRVTLKAEDMKLDITDTGDISISGNAIFAISTEHRCGNKQISACRINKDRAKLRDKGSSLVLRNIGESESIWSIAKQYNTTMQAILAANKLPDDSELVAGRLIIIPFAI